MVRAGKIFHVSELDIVWAVSVHTAAAAAMLQPFLRGAVAHIRYWSN